jgi:hypothetical protein
VKTSVIALGLAFVLDAHAQEHLDRAEPAGPTTDDVSAETEAQVDEAPAVVGPLVADVVLPSGVRVVAARDTTLPVAAVVLALETGTEDDPPERPGLLHALGYQLLQGNRELPPEGVARIAHDGGGVTSMAIGPAQIRFEALVPVSLLDDMLWAESQRLRTPTVDEASWRDSLGWARRDARRNRALALDALAALHGADGLGHVGRKASPEVEAMVPRAVAAELAERMTYARATLVVVSPLEPAVIVERTRDLFADLPEKPRRVHDRFSAPRAHDNAPRRFPQPDADGSTVAWPVPPGTEELERARLLCRVINRQRRVDPEPARVRLRCHLDEDPRRAALVLRATGTDDPLALVNARLQRIFEGTDDRLVEQQRDIVARALALELSTPLGLARRLATSDPRRGPAGASPLRPLGELTGLDTIRRSGGHGDAMADRYPLRAGLQIAATEEP